MGAGWSAGGVGAGVGGAASSPGVLGKSKLRGASYSGGGPAAGFPAGRDGLLLHAITNNDVATTKIGATNFISLSLWAFSLSLWADRRPVVNRKDSAE